MTITAEIAHAPAAAPGGQEAAARARAARLEERLGDPYDPANPHGLRALLAADARRLLPAETMALLAEEGFADEFVPVAHGGRLARADLLARVLRPVFRRDVALGLGCGTGALLGAGAVWAAGRARQRRHVARTLLTGGGVTVLHREPAHAGALPREEVTARRTPGGYRLDGRGSTLAAARHPGPHLVYARTGAEGVPGSHSVLLLDPAGQTAGTPAGQAAGTVRHLSGGTPPGGRGMRPAGVEFRDCFVPAEGLVGREGDGIVLGLRTLPVERSVMCAALTAAGDTVLRCAVRAATAGRPGPVATRLHRPLAGVFCDLLTCDAAATAALRALSLLPAAAHLFAAAVQYLVPGLLREGLEELATVLGARAHRHDSPEYGALGKLMRDLPVTGLGHTGGAACQTVLVAHLRGLAERSWFAEAEPPPGLFRPGADLPPLRHALLAAAGGGDFMAASLVGCAGRLASFGGARGELGSLGRLARILVGELHALAAQVRRLPDRGARPAGTAALVLADRHSLLMCAAAVLRTWEEQDGTDPFLADPAWAVLALTRIGERLGVAVPDLPGGIREHVVDELLRRYREGGDCHVDAAARTR